MTATQQDLSSAPTPVVNGTTKRRRFWPLEFYRSAVGKKYVMAITGVIGLAFVLGHMVGNLKLYLGAGDMNHYGEFLRELLVPLLPRTWALWGFRLLLIGALVLHVHAAYALTVMNRRARPERYAGGRDYVVANYASRTMRWSGIIVLLFIGFHLLDLTAGTVNPEFVRGDPANNMVATFDGRPLVAAGYVIANLALGIHIFHGAWSLFQSIGANNPRFNRWRRSFAQGFAALIVLGNVSFPVLISAGVVDRDAEARVEACESRGELGTAEPCLEAEAEADA
ncbi:MAG: succinate dehydrogenase cytochrome b subunit [Acidimicrobiales bacterium]